ncbi:Rrf2 family transcriptional regulator [Halorubrum aethiopicum]|uniref:Rrf2 family transcriptional regulator n=1 Tax=Halorubrum aethiopicum TaxID=1758255 RepID=UPI0009B5B038|nr:Rrf2 family transcriptional regulator [Halorubrum aethiopicum]
MQQIELTTNQTSLLATLISLYEEEQEPISSERIAREIQRSPGTIRNQMQSLTSLELIEGIQGAGGGYRPKSQSYDTLDVQKIEDPDYTLIKQRNSEIHKIVSEINLSSVGNPEVCRVKVHILGSMSDINIGEEITIGPTPVSNFVVSGLVDGKCENQNIIMIESTSMSVHKHNRDR